MKNTILIFFLTLCLFNFSNKTSAQSTAFQDTVNVKMVPETPKAGELVSVFLTSYYVNIDSAKITWTLDGKNIKSGTGEKNFVFTMGKTNEKTSLVITINTKEEGVIVKKYNLRPTSVDMIWESNGFVPPFYKGKTLFVGQNKITVIAIPHIPDSNGNILSDKNLIFKWKKNGTVIQDASGYGKNFYTFDGSLISRNFSISVEVSSQDGESTGFGLVDLSPADPLLVMYEKSPTYGIQFQKALVGNQNIGNSNEISVVAFPFYYNSNDLESGNLINKWSINGVEIENSDSRWSQIFRKKEGVSGTASISVSTENQNRILQYSKTSFNLSFNQTNN